jgi:hypothetical protein
MTSKPRARVDAGEKRFADVAAARRQDLHDRRGRERRGDERGLKKRRRSPKRRMSASRCMRERAAA